jgi:putative phosphoesterase
VRNDSRQVQQFAPGHGTEDASAVAGSYPQATETCRIGVIGDTHGYLDPAVLDLFAQVDHVIHCGDIGDPEILAELAKIGPLTAVAGNLDQGEWADPLPSEVSARVAGIRFVVGHKRKRLMKRFTAGKLSDGEPRTPPDLVVFGHEHQSSVFWVDTTLFLNPGSAASPYEEDEAPTVAIVETGAGGLSVLFIPLCRREAGSS